MGAYLVNISYNNFIRSFMEMTIQEIREINKKIDELSSCRKMLYNWCEDMNSATQLLEKMSEDVVAIQKYKGDWHVYHKDKGDWVFLSAG